METGNWTLTSWLPMALSKSSCFLIIISIFSSLLSTSSACRKFSLFDIQFSACSQSLQNNTTVLATNMCSTVCWFQFGTGSGD